MNFRPFTGPFTGAPYPSNTMCPLVFVVWHLRIKPVSFAGAPPKVTHTEAFMIIVEVGEPNTREPPRRSIVLNGGSTWSLKWLKIHRYLGWFQRKAPRNKWSYGPVLITSYNWWHGLCCNKHSGNTQKPVGVGSGCVFFFGRFELGWTTRKSNWKHKKK